jgi:hypothetical protein
MTTNAQTLSLAGYHVVRDLRAVPPLNPQHLFDYLLAGNGLFIRSARPELVACVPVAVCPVRGLPPLEPQVRLRPPRVPGWLVVEIRARARSERGPGGEPVEALYHLTWDAKTWQWRLDKPRQVQRPASVEPLGPFAGTSYATHVVDVHTHPMNFRDFSLTDDVSEAGRLRLSAVLADLWGRPCLRLRATVFGHLWDVPASAAFELPDGLVDGLGEREAQETVERTRP